VPSEAKQRTNLLLTGLPGVGKTTVLRRVVERLSDLHARGFLTDEIRPGGRRLGFRITSLDGREATLAHTDFRGGPRVGRYGVDVDALRGVVSAAMAYDESTDVYLIDEIGKMECFSREFVEATETLLSRKTPLVATIARKGGGFIAGVKKRPDIELWEVTRGNRDQLPEAVTEWIAKQRG
jgi:nucleoside-triphosphatase